jgi:hypothetical protein
VLRLVHSEPGGWKPAYEEARNSPVEQSGDEPDRVAPDSRADEWTDPRRVGL